MSDLIPDMSGYDDETAAVFNVLVRKPDEFEKWLGTVIHRAGSDVYALAIAIRVAKELWGVVGALDDEVVEDANAAVASAAAGFVPRHTLNGPPGQCRATDPFSFATDRALEEIDEAEQDGGMLDMDELAKPEPTLRVPAWLIP